MLVCLMSSDNCRMFVQVYCGVCVGVIPKMCSECVDSSPSGVVHMCVDFSPLICVGMCALCYVVLSVSSSCVFSSN